MLYARNLRNTFISPDKYEQYLDSVQVKLTRKKTKELLQKLFDYYPTWSYARKVVKTLMEEPYLSRIWFTMDGTALDSRIVLNPYDGMIMVDSNVGWGTLEKNQVVYKRLVGKDAAESLLPMMADVYCEVMVQLPRPRAKGTDGFNDVCNEVSRILENKKKYRN